MWILLLLVLIAGIAGFVSRDMDLGFSAVCYFCATLITGAILTLAQDSSFLKYNFDPDIGRAFTGIVAFVAAGAVIRTCMRISDKLAAQDREIIRLKEFEDLVKGTPGKEKL